MTRSVGGSACATRRARERDNEAHWFIVAAVSIDETSYVQAIHLTYSANTSLVAATGLLLPSKCLAVVDAQKNKKTKGYSISDKFPRARRRNSDDPSAGTSGGVSSPEW